MKGISVIASLGCLLALPALGEPALQGEWKITIPSYPDYVGMVMIDAAGRAIVTDDYGKPWRGYVAHVDSMRVEFAITSGAAVARVLCSVQSRDLLHCNGRYTDGRTFKGASIMTRTGRPAPRSLATTTR